MITGGTSLLARQTAARLAARGDDVVVVQRSVASVDGASSVRADVRDRSAIDRAVEGCDAVIHAAAKVGVVGSWDEYRSINVDGTACVLAAARAAGVTRFVHVSTPSVGHIGDSLVGRPAEHAVTGRRRAFYAESKAISEALVLDASDDVLPVVAVRPHLVWGPGDTQLVGRIVERARQGRLALVGDGAALVDTTYIDNAADALVAALDAVGVGAPCAGRAYVVANGEPRPIRELVEGIVKAAGMTPRPRRIPRSVAVSIGTVVESIWPLLRRSSEPPITRFLAEQLGTAHWFDPRETRRDLRWEPAVTIDEGLGRLAGWFAAGARPV